MIYGGPLRAPVTLWNEKVAPQLGKALDANGGAIPDEAMDEAIAALARYRHIVDDLGIEDSVDVMEFISWWGSHITERARA